MGFGPWGAAAGAAIGLVVGGIGKLIEKEKELQAMSDATFKSSTAVAEMFGGAVKDVGFHMSNLNNATPDFTGFSKEYKDFTDMVKKLPKDDPLSLFLKNIKGQTGGQLQATVRAFTDTQIALGNLDPSKASNYLKMILTYTGKMNEYNNVANGIAQTQSAAITSSLNALEKVDSKVYFTVGSGKFSAVASKTATEYKELNHAQQTVVDSLGQFYNMANNATNIKTLDDVIKGIGDSAYNSADGFNLLKLYAEKMGDQKLIDRLKQLQEAGMDLAKALLIIKAQSLGINTDTIIKNKIPFGSSPATRGGKTILEGLTEEQLTKLIENQFKEVDKVLGTGKGTGGNGTGGTLDSLISALEKQKNALEEEKAALDKSIQSQKEYNDQLQKTQDFLVKQTDLQNQIRVARAKGDYLQAGLLQQQLTSAQVTYNATASLSPAEQRSKDLQSAIDALTTEIRDANQKNKDIKKANKAAGNASGGYIRSYGQGSWGGVFGPGTATSDSIPAMLSNGEYVLSASAVKNVPGGIKTLDGINSGNMSAFNSNVSNAYSIAVNVASSNASPDEIAQVVMRTIERRANMNSTLRVV
jgi:ribosome-associated translation inhibitor RaiA